MITAQKPPITGDTLDLLSLRRLSASTFGVLMSLGPALAAVAGFLILQQRLTLVAVLAIGLVVAASIGAVLGSARTRDLPGMAAAARSTAALGGGNRAHLSASVHVP